ncbi:MAG: hypothetical protein KTR30_12870 [Saprospiraceae bacterium]|nr:hypothetical protein [Saprospiraceae bacterium]
MNYQNQEGHLSDESIARYVEVLQSEDWESLPDEVQNHIDSCDTCQQEAMDLYAIVSHSSQTIDVKVPIPKTGARVLRLRVMRWAMVAVLAGLSFYLYRYLDRPKPIDNIEVDSPIANDPGESNGLDQQDEEDSPTSTPKKEETVNPSKTTTPVSERDVRDLYAANFVPSESMELLLADQLRSSSVELVSPVNEKVQNWKSGIDFQWAGIAEVGLSIHLENNLGERIYEQPIVGRRHNVQMELEPGIYYWRLESEEDLLMVGRLVLE